MRKRLAIAALTLVIAYPAIAQIKPAPEETAPGAVTSTPGGAIPNDTNNTLNRPSTIDGHAGSQACEKMAANAAGGAMARNSAESSANSIARNANAAPNPNCPPQINGYATTSAPAIKR